MKPRILVDCDGVLANFTDAYLNLVHEMFGRALVVEDVTSFNFQECIVSAKEDAAVWERIKSTPGYVRGLPLLPGVEGALKALRDIGTVVCVTSPVWGCSWADERFHWLVDLGFCRRTIVFASDKSHVHGDYLIDDHSKNLDEWSEVHEEGAPVLIDAPYNRQSGHLRALSITGAAELVRLIEESNG